MLQGASAALFVFNYVTLGFGCTYCILTMLQGASAALTAARRHVAKAGSSFRRRGREYQQR